MNGNLETNAAIPVAVVIVNYRTPALTVRCVQSLLPEREALPSLNVIVVDGGSGDGSAEILQRELSAAAFQGWVEVISLPINGGFGWANNQAIRRLLRSRSKPTFIHLLNPDAEIEPGAVRALLEAAESYDRAGAVGSQLVELDGSLAGSAFHFPTIRGEFARGARTAFVDNLLRVPLAALPPQDQVKQVDWVTGASVLFRSEALLQSGLFDDGFFLYHEEVELMWRLRECGWKVLHQPLSRVRHVGGAATGICNHSVQQRIEPARPPYWYQSRRRLLARTRGPALAAVATLLWLAGHLLWRLRHATGLASTARPVSRELRDVLRHGFPKRIDQVAGHVGIDEPDGSRPLWMTALD